MGVTDVGSLSVSGKLEKNAVNLFQKRCFFIIIIVLRGSQLTLLICLNKKQTPQQFHYMGLQNQSCCMQALLQLPCYCSDTVPEFPAGLPQAPMAITIGMSSLTAVGGVNHTVAEYALHYLVP